MSRSGCRQKFFPRYKLIEGLGLVWHRPETAALYKSKSPFLFSIDHPCLRDRGQSASWRDRKDVAASLKNGMGLETKLSIDPGATDQV